MKDHNRNAVLEKHKKQFAIKKGYKSWNELRQSKRLQDSFRDLHEIAINAIEELQSELKKYE